MAGKISVAVVPAVVTGVLTIAYVATLAPSVTLWDAGEFLAAIHSVGIPHPPGTPLYVIVGAAWARVFSALLGFARSVNLLSAVATAVGCAVLGASVARWTSSRVAGIAAGIAAGSMLSVWRNATETEVYALSLALALIALGLADRAGSTGRSRDAVVVTYVLALAVPLHLSALVIVPGVVAFAAMDRDGRVHAPKAVMLSGAALLTMALGTALPALALLGVVVILVGSLTRRDGAFRMRLREGAALAAVVLLAATGVLIMYVRAQHDPFVNQGNPATIDALVGVVGRAQYDVPPLWPRRAPFWLQLGNLVQYADWQVASGLDQWVGPSVRRTPLTLLFAALAIAGAAWHRARDRRSFRAVAVALASASLGAVAVLNLRAGPSFGFSVLPESATHEARERDYFFAIAFALAAAWAGMGATRAGAWLATRLTKPRVAPAVALALAAAPLLLNWRAADRSTGGAPTLAEQFARALLDVAPPNAVLVVAGDNDTYPLWFLQEVESHRRDVTVVTIPLLPATWYRWELQRRHGLALAPTANAWRGVSATMADVAARAHELGRPVAVANSVPARERTALGREARWIARGMVFVHAPDAAQATPLLGARVAADTLQVVAPDAAEILVDTSVALGQSPKSPMVGGADPTDAYVAALLRCPAQILAAARRRRGSVDPRCNLR